MRYRFRQWCRNAVSDIVFPPDRETVAQELYAHMEDHLDALLEEGRTEDAAEQLVVTSMGSPWEIAPVLGKIHRPFWGYFLRCTRIALVIALIVTAVGLWKHFQKEDYGQPDVWHFNIYDPKSFDDGSNGTLLFFDEPDCTQTFGGSDLTLTHAVVWKHPDAVGDGTLYCKLRLFDRRLWSQYYNFAKWIWAEDSLGNVYLSHEVHEADAENRPHFYTGYCHTGPFTWGYELWINEYISHDAQWIDLHYDRDGSGLVWRIDLTGGDAS